MKTIKDIDINNKKVIIRCDFNVPIKNGIIIDDTRIRNSLETINYCIEKNAKIILLSHLGRIKEEKDKEKNNLKIVADRLEELLNKTVTFINETRGINLEKAISNMNNKDIILIQNTRYEDLTEKKESSNNQELGKYWASLGDIFINDAFGTVHRAHASNVGIATYLPSAIGFLIEKELNKLKELDNPERPYVVILGGAKVKDKIGVITNLVTKADKLIIGGGMAFTFLKALGYNIGKSIVDLDNINFCKEILDKYSSKIILPIDFKTTLDFSNEIDYKIKDKDNIEANEMGLDIGPKSIDLFTNALSNAKTVVWNGPIGVYEFDKYKEGTDKILAYLTNHNIKTFLGGGDIVAAAKNYKDKIYHISTGGGATLEYLEGKKLPGIEIIK